MSSITTPWDDRQMNFCPSCNDVTEFVIREKSRKKSTLATVYKCIECGSKKTLKTFINLEDISGLSKADWKVPA